MYSTTIAEGSPTEVTFPDDVSLWFGAADLARLALQAAAHASATSESSSNPAVASTELNLFAAIISCYASGIYGSEEVQWAAASHPAVRQLTRDFYLTPPVVIRFRRWHRTRLELALGRLLAATIASLRAFDSEQELQSAALVEARKRVQLSMLFDIP